MAEMLYGLIDGQAMVSVMTLIALDSGWVNEAREFREEAVDRCTPVVVFTLGVSELAAWTCRNNEVTPFIMRFFQQSTRRLKRERKSTPMRGYMTSAITNRNIKSRCRPKLRLRSSHL